MKKIFLIAFLILSSTISNNVFAQLPKTYNFQPQGEPIYVVDGIVVPKTYLDKLNPDQIEFMSVLKEEKATEKYGDKAINGVIEITTKKDAAINNDHIGIMSTDPQPIIIIDGVEVKGSLNDISPDDIESMSVFKGDDAINKYGSKGKNGVVEITTKKATEKSIKVQSKDISNPIYVVDGNEISKLDVDKLDKDTIEKISVLKGEKAIEKYGDKGKNGVVEIFLKK